MKTPLLCTLILALAAAPAVAFEAANLVKNAGFDELYENGLPSDWSNISHPNYLKSVGTTVSVVPEGPFYRVTRTQNNGVELGEQRVALVPTLKTVRIALRIRSVEFKKGDQDWQAPGLSYSWILAAGGEREIGPGRWLLLKQPTANWTALETVLEKPADAVGIKVNILGIGWTGTADYDDITVEPLE